jgi:hypothetical protein
LDPVKSEFLRIDFDLLADEEDALRGSTGSMTLIYIDGIPLDTHDRVDITMLAHDKKRSPARVISDQTFSNYQKFVSTSRIVPESESKGQQ